VSGCGQRADSNRQSYRRLEAASGFCLAQYRRRAAGRCPGRWPGPARTAGLEIAAFIQAVKGPKAFFPRASGMPRPVIPDRDFGKAARRATALPRLCGHASGHCPPDWSGSGAALPGLMLSIQMLRPADRHIACLPRPGRRGRGVAHQLRQITILRILAALARAKARIVIEHALHFGDVAPEFGNLFAAIIASASFILVSGVLMSWLTPASISVRWFT